MPTPRNLRSPSCADEWVVKGAEQRETEELTLRKDDAGTSPLT